MSKILVVEDERKILEDISEMLQLTGYEVITAEDGKNASKIAIDENPDLIVTDIMMPQMDEYELLKKLRSNTRTEQLPVIFLTAKTDRESLRTGMGLGADDYITKPYVADELLNAVKIRIEKSKAHEKTLDDLRLNLTKYVPHELRTPLVPILGLPELIIEDLEYNKRRFEAHAKNNLEVGKKAG